MKCKLQTIYSLIFNKIYKYTSRIEEKYRNAVITIAWTLISLITVHWYLIYYVNLPGLNYTQLMLIMTLLLVIITIFSINGPLKPVRWNRLFYWIYFLFAIWMFAMCFVHHTGAGIRPFSLMLIVIFPCLYFVWNNRGDYIVLFDRMAIGSVISAIPFYCVQAYAFFSSEETVYVRFVGTAENPNVLAMICVSFVIASIYLSVRYKKARVALYIVIVVALALIILSQSRTAMISIIGVLIICIIFYISGKDIKKKALMICASFAVIAICSIGTILIISYCSDEQAVSYPDNTNTQEKLMSPLEKITDRFDFQGKDLNEFSSGRIGIWVYYFQRLNMFGNDYTEAYSSTLPNKWTHNSVLEYASRCGIPAGIFFLILEVFVAVYIFNIVFMQKKRDLESLYIALVSTVYLIISQLEVVYLPKSYDFVLSFIIILMIIGLQKEEQSTEGEQSK